VLQGKIRLFLLFGVHAFVLQSQQHFNEITATLDGTTKEVQIKQRFTYVNHSNTTLNSLYFNDWNHAYSSNTTPLSKHFDEDFDRRLHLALDRERGYTTITSMVDNDYEGLIWERTDGQDIIKILLNEPLAPGDSTELFLTYTIRLPDDKFTGYGYDDKGQYYLKDWYLTPAVFDGEWKLYSNKGLEDLYTDVTQTKISFIFPKGLFLATNYDNLTLSQFPQGQNVQLRSENRKSCEIILSVEDRFTTHLISEFRFVSDIEASKYDEIAQGISIVKIARFLEKNLGKYPHGSLLVSQIDYEKSPLYGINQLPSFIRPYEEQFQFELAFLKTALNQFLKETLFLNPRKERWVHDAMANYLMIKYVEEFYPDQKLIGKLSKIWGLRSFHLAEMNFNEQYNLLQMVPVRSNRDQALTTSNDSLTIYNQKIANRYKAGLGLSYLADYIGQERVDSTIIDFYNVHKLSPKTKVQDFKNVLQLCADDDLDWFFEEYVSTRKKIDFKIKKVTKTDDSITFTLKNKRGTNVPISVFGLKKDSVVSKYWFSNIDSAATFTIPRSEEDRLVLNYDKKIPEFNQRDNWKTLNGFFSSNKKLKFTFFKDTEDPYYNQVFYVPSANFNIYDGITPNLRIYNVPFLEKPFRFNIAPGYSFLEQTLVGSANLRYRKYHGQGGHYVSDFFVGGSTSHFQTNSRVTTLTPSITLGWRPDNLRSNKRQFLLLRHRNVLRSIDDGVLNDDSIDLDLENNPDYSVFNARYTNFDNNIVNFKSAEIDFQHSSEFTKVSVELDYRRLFESNRQLNLRFFAGKFLRNDTNSDFFSFALDRPTDYLFDLDYIGRSEDSGFSSQQIIIAEGGFKSQFDDQFGSDWIATGNASFNVWRWVELYGDIGFIGDQGESARFVYDSGVRLNLVTDYFELYFPLYSNNGWEIGQPNYENAIRFVITISPRTLTGLFTRRWF